MTISSPLSYSSPGFGALSVGDLTVNGSVIPVDFHNSITNVLVHRSINMASSLTLSLSDPKRLILNNPNLLQQGTSIEIPDGFGNYLQFALVQFSKSADTLTMQFESRSVYDLRNIRNVTNASDIVDAASFVQGICSQHGIGFVGPAGDAAINPKVYAASTGTTSTPNETAWSAFQRIASTLGWRCWESAGVIFFGPDEYWFNVAGENSGYPANLHFFHTSPTIQEFTQEIQNIDFSWDVGGAFADLTITCMANFWQYNPGEIVNISNLGIANGPWLISSMERDFFTPKATVVCTVPMPSPLILVPPTLPIVAGRPQFGNTYQ